MRTTYRLEAEIAGASDAVEILGTALDALNTLSEAETGETFDVRARLGSDFSILARGYRGPRLTSALTLPDAENPAAGLRYDGPPVAAGGSDLRLDVILSGSSVRGGSGSLGVAIEVARPPGFPNRFEDAAPAVVGRLARAFGLRRGGRRLQIEPVELDKEAVASDLVPRLLSPDRETALVACSPVRLTGRPIMAPAVLQQAVVGLADVVVVASAEATFPIAQGLGSPFACYDGAVRVYLPGLSPSDPPSRHPLWKPDEQYAARDFPAAVLDLLLRQGQGGQGGRVPSWEALEAESFRKRLVPRVEQDVLELVRERERSLLSRIEALEKEVEDERHRAESLQGDVRALRELLADGEAPGEPAGREEESKPDADSPASVVARTVERHAGRLVLALNSRSRLKGYPLEDVGGLAAALEFLATTYWEARFAGAAQPDLDGALRAAAPGFSYRAHQSSSTMGRFPDDYVTTWEGRSYPLLAHVGRGNSRDPRHSIRVAFATDPERRVVIIGYVGQHQRTEA